MAIHYNAFISYRHHPDDIRVASDIHRSLERFRVPRPLRKKTKPITRLFRDKEELPITSDLNDDIAEALRNSDFLIVICSAHTKESIWVQREIELFLSTHPRSRVLTVLASGEPYDVIPEILLTEEITDPVTGERTTRQVEPLSCDWRGKRRYAMREELPRLAAALMGCGYDELRQRQKQYRARRAMTAVSISLAASLCLAAYFLQTSITIYKANQQIQQNLEAALRNQSQHLATAAAERLKEGDRFTAIALAAAALPSEENVRPYVPEAEYVLCDALGVYRTTPRTAAIGAFSPGANLQIKDFRVTEDGKTLYIFDQRNMVTVWDTEALKKTAQFPLDGTSLLQAAIVSDGSLLVRSDLYLSAYGSDGSCLWRMEHCWDFVLLSDKSGIAAIADTQDRGRRLLFLDCRTGEELRESISLEDPDSEEEAIAFYADTANPEGCAAVHFTALGSYSVRLVDFATGAMSVLPAQVKYPSAATFSEDGKLLVMGAAETDSMVGIYEGNRITASILYSLCCFDSSDGSLLWESALETYVFTGDTTLCQIPESERILCQAGPTFQVLDLHSGETLARCEAGSGIISVSVGPEYADAVTQDGYFTTYWYEDNYCYENKAASGPLDRADKAGNYFCLELAGSQVTMYGSQDSEKNWEYTFDSYLSIQERLVCGHYLAFRDWDHFYLFDLEARELLWSRTYDRGRLLGFSADGSCLYFTGEEHQLCTLEIASGNLEEKNLEGFAELASPDLAEDYYFAGDRLYYPCRDLTHVEIGCLDLTTGQTAFFTTGAPEDPQQMPGMYQVLAATGTHLWLWVDNSDLVELDMTSGGLRTIGEQLSRQPFLAVKEDGSLIAVSTPEGVVLRQPGGDELAAFAPEEGAAADVCFFAEELLVLCDNGFLYRMDPAGTQLSGTKLDVAYGFESSLFGLRSSQQDINWQFTDDGLLILDLFSTANVIDCDSWKLRTSIQNHLWYSDQGFLCKSGSTLMSIPCYSTEMLLSEAREVLHDFRLTPEQKAAYGLS